MILDALVTILILGALVFIALLVLSSAIIIVTISPLLIFAYAILELLRPREKR